MSGRPTTCQPVVKARIKLILDEPYLAAAVAQFPMVDATDDGWCDTMATDGYRIYYNRTFCESISASDVQFVLAHEICHCIFGHIERLGDRNRELWNVATDLATNFMLGEFGMPVPKNALISDKYKDQTAEDIYDSLRKESRKTLVELGLIPAGGKASGKGSKRKMVVSTESSSTGNSGRSTLWRFDNHLTEKPPTVVSSSTIPVDSELRDLRRGLIKPIENKLKSFGKLPGWWDETVKMAGGEEIAWREVLSRFMTGISHDDYRWFPPNKKHIWRKIYLPSIGSPAPHNIVAAVDTSGSMGTQELSSVLFYLDSLRRSHNATLTVIECDTKIQRVRDYEAWDEANFSTFKFAGRGGTDFRPVFDLVQKNQSKGKRYDCLIFLTDAMGPFPIRPPDYPVMWIIYGRHFTPPFGEVLRVL